MTTPPKWSEVPARVRADLIEFLERGAASLEGAAAEDLLLDRICELRAKANARRAAARILRAAGKKKARRR